jgi:hypothetical protein
LKEAVRVTKNMRKLEKELNLLLKRAERQNNELKKEISTLKGEHHALKNLIELETELKRSLCKPMRNIDYRNRN